MSAKKDLAKRLNRKRSVLAVGPAKSHSVRNAVVDVKGEVDPITPPGHFCSHNVNFVYWFDHDKGTWVAQITWTEMRQGRPYGKPVVDRVTYKERRWRDDNANFMKKVRNHIKKWANIYWK